MNKTQDELFVYILSQKDISDSGKTIGVYSYRFLALQKHQELVEKLENTEEHEKPFTEVTNVEDDVIRCDFDGFTYVMTAKYRLNTR
jgi:hypothetical protein